MATFSYSVGRARGRSHIGFAFTCVRLETYINGCFWYSSSDHGSQARSISGYWVPKLVANHNTDARPQQAGWTVLRVGEQESATIAVSSTEAALRALTAHSSTMSTTSSAAVIRACRRGQAA